MRNLRTVPRHPDVRRAPRPGSRLKTLDWDQYTVYNDAEAIFDHPDLEWDVIRRYFKRFYSQAYFRNPRYLWRRFRYMVQNG